MDQWKPEKLSISVSIAADLAPSTTSFQTHSHSLPSNRLQKSHPDPRQKPEVAARKVQKADREKLKRDRLNEHFLELGNTLEHNRPKTDKAAILTGAIQMLKDLTSEVNRLKAECAALSEDSRELTQEKNELKEVKASLKSDIESLNVQYQQRLRVMFPWAAIDPSVVMGPHYSYPIPLPISPSSILMYPSVQPFHFFGNQNTDPFPTPCSTYVPYPAPANDSIEQPTAMYASTSRISRKQGSSAQVERCKDSNDVATELELKMPGSSTQQDSSSEGQTNKNWRRK